MYIYCNVKEHMFCATIVLISYYLCYFLFHFNYLIHKFLSTLISKCVGYFCKIQSVMYQNDYKIMWFFCNSWSKQYICVISYISDDPFSSWSLQKTRVTLKKLRFKNSIKPQRVQYIIRLYGKKVDFSLLSYKTSYFYIEKWTFKVMCEVYYRAKRDKKEVTWL